MHSYIFKILGGKKRKKKNQTTSTFTYICRLLCTARINVHMLLSSLKHLCAIMSSIRIFNTNIYLKWWMIKLNIKWGYEHSKIVLRDNTNKWVTMKSTKKKKWLSHSSSRYFEMFSCWLVKNVKNSKRWRSKNYYRRNKNNSYKHSWVCCQTTGCFVDM